MTKNLVIVESPTKAKMLSKFLGKEYTVESSYGHIRDLPSKKSELTPVQQKLPYASMAIDTENGFRPLYVIPQKAKKYAQKLKGLLDENTTIWLASDEDREGEAISWHLLEVLKPKKTNAIKRIVFHEITKSAILEAVKTPRKVDMDLVHAQQARRILDRLVGYTLSPLLWKKIRYGLSAGRVQSVAVKLIVDREREIRAFTPEEYWSITAPFEKDSKTFVADFQKLDGKKFVPKTKEEAEAITTALRGQPFSVSTIDEKEVKRRPSPPFITSTLQQEAARKLGFSVKRTMALAQILYEGIDMGGGEAGGLITYMRTDSVNLSQKALSESKEVIEKRYGKEFSETRVYKSKSKGAQEAHEAIRPTEVSRTPEEVYAFPKTKLEEDARKLYELIWNRTIASQMADARLLQTGADLEALGKSGAKKSHIFRATGQRVLFPGFLKLYTEGRDDEKNENEENILPELKTGESLKPKSIDSKQHFTKPPARYTEASLVKKMESEGIGRPSTYAPTISTIITRGYILREARQLVPTDIAFAVTDLLENHFHNVVDLKFTAHMEDQLDSIATREKKWDEFLREFYTPFLKTAQEGESISRAEAKKERQLGKCPETGLPIFAKIGKYGAMLQRGETESERKPDFAPILKSQSMETITFEEALLNFSLPRLLGKAEDGEDVAVGVGRFGPYVRHGKTFVSIREDELFTLKLDEAMERIREKASAKQNRILKDFPKEGIQVVNGRFGPYVTDGKKNAKISTETDPKKLSLSDCKLILEKAIIKKFQRK
ncbi:type I DNA topoisomerase [Candidatus Peregrinibacteria bacterium]|nr:MAG: type I DNA topoisomerase [Candidatus Peregrinibacteria bacterium]